MRIQAEGSSGVVGQAREFGRVDFETCVCIANLDVASYVYWSRSIWRREDDALLFIGAAEVCNALPKSFLFVGFALDFGETATFFVEK